MHRDKYNAQPQPEIKTISCICGYHVPADRDGVAILRCHQELCRKFKGIPEEEPK